ncbi:MAG: hypothetical protein HZB70_02700 [Candidatus Berkelbacteria bacterium]|nr:MAG: hypothetical protein HZB70_02700 [Candidatus Berkelbacteria bacterium]QQG51784.1 MAG: hypothetical protein HY845_00295 [Candidatus Berkelbacteria bacterium]
MIERYAQEDITAIFSDKTKVKRWQDTEIAVTQAYTESHEFSEADFREFKGALLAHPVDLKWWKRRDEKIHHDLNAFLEERARRLPTRLQPLLHSNMTSYDTQEAAFARTLIDASHLVLKELAKLKEVLQAQALKHRFSLMVGKTHGQQGELQTHGKRCITWLRALEADRLLIEQAKAKLRYSKISGAVGNWGPIHPDIERRALEILGLEPYCGATQIIPREIYTPLADALAQTVLTIDKIALDIRLNARTPLPLYHEPFAKEQKGSSAMPHKKNPINTEQLEGMGRMASTYAAGIKQNIRTWEERAIEQSCVERVFWPDLFHVTMRAVSVLTKVLKGLVIYRHNMLIEIILSRGCYATAGAKEVLKQLVEPHGLKAEDAYRVIQLAAFNIFEYSGPVLSMPKSLDQAEQQLAEFTATWQFETQPTTLADYVMRAELQPSSQLKASAWKIKQWNRALRKVFVCPQARLEWTEAFRPTNVLKHEAHLFEQLCA